MRPRSDSSTQRRRLVQALRVRAAKVPGARDATAGEGPVALAHPTQVEHAPTGEDFLNAPKRDGYRMTAIVAGGRVRLRSRQGIDWTARLGSIVRAIESLGVDDAQLDGELIAVGEDGLEDFELLQATIGGAPRARVATANAPLAYIAFDLMRLQGLSLTSVPLLERHRLLDALVAGTGVSSNGYELGRGPELFEAIRAAGHEGMVAKRAEDPYPNGRTRSWLKLIARKMDVFVIVGYMKAEGDSTGGLMLAMPANGALEYIGRVGVGLGRREFAQLHSVLETQRTPSLRMTPYFAARAHRIRWYKPEHLAKIAFRSWTPSGALRHPAYKGLATDLRR